MHAHTPQTFFCFNFSYLFKYGVFFLFSVINLPLWSKVNPLRRQQYILQLGTKAQEKWDGVSGKRKINYLKTDIFAQNVLARSGAIY